MNQRRDFSNISTLSIPKLVTLTYTSSIQHLTTILIHPYAIHDLHTSDTQNISHDADDQQKIFNEGRHQIYTKFNSHNFDGLLVGFTHS